MYADYNTLMHQVGFDALSSSAKTLIRSKCQEGEIRFCDTCGKLINGGYYEDISSDGNDWCSSECMEASGYTFKDMLVDFYDTPMEGENGYNEMMKAKAELSDTEFDVWLSERYEENPDAPVFWTELYPYSDLEPGSEEILSWLEVLTWLSGITLTKTDLIKAPCIDTSPFRREIVMKTPDGEDVTVVVTDKELMALEEIRTFRNLRNLIIEEAENRSIPYDHDIIEELTEEAIDSWNDDDESEKAMKAVNTAFEIYRENNS